MTRVVINVMGIKVREYETEKPFVPDITGFQKAIKQLEKESNGKIKVKVNRGGK